ncbi:MAG TPA: serine hydrolase, partial [Actinomycetota bacterium]|nr:serine hydrolase [Actinomycetota bacterium]
LLTHTAGIPEVRGLADLLQSDLTPSGGRPAGLSVRFGEPLPSLAEYYRAGLRIVVEPGTAFAYTNHGFATLGQIVEDVSGEALDRYFREHIFEPLGMGDTDLVRSERIASRLATGYELRSHGAEAVPDYEVITLGGGGVYSTPNDMARYVAALLGGGENEHGVVLKPETLATMFEPHYQRDSRIPGIGLAFLRADLGGHLGIEHDGILPGFDSLIFLAPGDGIGVMAFANGARRRMHWLRPEVERLLRRLLGVPDETIRTDIPHHPEIWDDLCGWYRFSGHPRDPGRLAVGAGVEVVVRRGQLLLRALSPIPALYRGVPLHPDDGEDPYVFRTELPSLGAGRVVFSREAELGTTAVHLFPRSFRKEPAARNPRSWASGAVGALAVAASMTAARRVARHA